MKKITLVIFAFLLSYMGFAQFGPEGFEGTWTTGSGPAGWTIINAAGPIQTWQQQTSNATFLRTLVTRLRLSTGKRCEWYRIRRLAYYACVYSAFKCTVKLLVAPYHRR
jgi:hypothetical protein